MATDSEYRECPFCAEVIKAKAVKCKHCKSYLGPLTEIQASGKEVIPCPECGQDIIASAKKCKHCKSLLIPGEQPKDKLFPATEPGLEPDHTRAEDVSPEPEAAIAPVEPEKSKELQEPGEAFEPADRQEAQAYREEEKPLFDNVKRKASLLLTGFISRIDIARVKDGVRKLALKIAGLVSKIDKKFFSNSKERLLSEVAGLSTRVKSGFDRVSSHKVVRLTAGLLTAGFILFVGFQVIGQFRGQESVDQVAVEKPLEIYSDQELEQFTAESQIEIVFANRLKEFEDVIPPDSESELVLVIHFTGPPDVEMQNTQLLYNGETRSFSSGYRITRGDEVTCTFAAIVPKDILDFVLYVGDHPPVKVHADQKIHDELQM